MSLALAFSCLGLAACSATPAATEASEPAPAAEADAKTKVSEGVDTPITVTGYKDLTKTYDTFLHEGDKVAVIAPSALPEPRKVKIAIEGLKGWGYVPVEGAHVSVDERTLDDCVEDLRWALSDPEIKGIFCVRGGHASSEVLDALPPSLISETNKPIIGYSDVSAEHAAWTVAGHASIHAPMWDGFDDGFDATCRDVVANALKGQVPVYECQGSPYDIEGTAQGILIGGNLSTIMTVLDTYYDCTAIDRPYILFLEEVGEDYQHVHRMLTLLEHKGVLDRAQAIVFGEWADYDPVSESYTGNSRGGEFTSMADMISRRFTGDRDIPVAFGFPSGHGGVNYPLIMGAPVRLSVDADSYTLEWL